jgi:hypothetical protein
VGRKATEAEQIRKEFHMSDHMDQKERKEDKADEVEGHVFDKQEKNDQTEEPDVEGHKFDQMDQLEKND